MTTLNPAIAAEIATKRKDIDVFHWDRVRKYGTLKNGTSFVVPVEADFRITEVSQDEVGRYHGNMIIEIRDEKLSDYSVGDWERIEEDD